MPRRDHIIITPAMRSYLRAFDAWLKHEWARGIPNGELHERKDMSLAVLLQAPRQ